MDNKFKSLETIIKEMANIHRNSELRKKVTNVARPDTATDPTDVKSKIAKQAEIKNKIIDEAKDEAPKKDSKSDESHMDDPKKVKGGKTEVDVQPTTDDRLSDDSAETKDSDKTRRKENKKIGQKGAPIKEAADTSVKKYEGPKHTYGPDGTRHKEVLKQIKDVITKHLNHTNFNKEETQMFSDKKFGVSESVIKSVLAIVEADKNKSIDGAESGAKSEKDETKKVAKMKGMCPSCKKSPCECMKEEKSCGCGGNCKCSTNEELKGGQKKLDKNHNGHLDKQDFEMLRGKKKMKEEAEHLDEISKKTAMSAYQSATFVDDEHPKADAIRGHIEKKWGKEMGKHADAHAHLSNYPRHNPFQKDDKLKSAKPASKMRTTASGKIHKQDIAAKKTEIKSRMKEEVEFSAEEIARIEAIAKEME